MKKQFDNLTISMNKLRSVPIQDRVALAGSPAASTIFGNLTPTEIAKLFPAYYQQKLPNISGFTEKAMSGYKGPGGGGAGGDGSPGGSTATPSTSNSQSSATKPGPPPSVLDQMIQDVNQQEF